MNDPYEVLGVPLERFAFPKQEPSRYARIFSFCIVISFPGLYSRRKGQCAKKKGPLSPSGNTAP